MPQRHTITAALLYANGPVHIGHLAGVYIPADIYARYLRLKGEEVLFVSGSDEHGVPITIRAEAEGITPQQVVDKYHQQIKTSFEELGISFDIYARTSSPVHHQTSSDFFKTLYDQGAFVEKEEEQYFDPEKERFLADRYIVGTCPNCGYEHAYGDQCERCGTSLSPKELGNPRSMLSGATPKLKPSKQWYLPLDKYQQEWIDTWIDEKAKQWKPNVYGQCKSWLNAGLQPRAMTRDLDWGVPVPLPNAEGKVLYVWFDAPIGYISATKEYFIEKARAEGKPDDAYATAWKPYWQHNDTALTHFIGKDNIVFHCIIFPAMLKAHGGYILPTQVPANEFMNLEGDKISTSRNWAVWLHEYLRDFPNKQDVLRYTLAANMPETKDNDFTWKDFQSKNNSELVAILGNFVNRAVVLTHKYFEGKVPPCHQLEAADQALIAELQAAPERIGQAIEAYRFREALSLLMDVARAGNKYFQDTAPWVLYKQDPEGNRTRIETILHIGLQLCANLAALAEPFLPFTAAKLREMLNAPQWSQANPQWQELGNIDLLLVGAPLAEASLLFEKIEDEAIQVQVDRLEGIKQARSLETAQAPSLAPLQAEIVFDDFAKIDLRVGTIVAAEKVKKTKKLLQLTVDTGIDQRTVVSGIAEHYSPEEVIGQQVCLVANLAPRELKGIPSQGMILMAEDAEGKLVFVSPQRLVNNGAGVK
ncbi:methionine--tRNA ligase [Eisenibacter elegans]|uniref:methionine--tRNA ligase n=1 Tax=Eisenibacter elegans TaxID=997 RepID=UPI0003F65240|nr:methionine--tRNA ligase [Eisenibacter elegans]